MTIEGGLAVASDRARLSIQQVAGRRKYEQKHGLASIVRFSLQATFHSEMREYGSQRTSKA